MKERKHTTQTRREFVEACGWLAIGPGSASSCLQRRRTRTSRASRTDPYRGLGSTPRLKRKSRRALDGTGKPTRRWSSLMPTAVRSWTSRCESNRFPTRSSLREPVRPRPIEDAGTQSPLRGRVHYDSSTRPRFRFTGSISSRRKAICDSIERSSYRWRRHRRINWSPSAKNMDWCSKAIRWFTQVSIRGGRRKRADAPRLIRRRLEQLAARYAADIPIWDGVNESSRRKLVRPRLDGRRLRRLGVSPKSVAC